MRPFLKCSLPRRACSAPPAPRQPATALARAACHRARAGLGCTSSARAAPRPRHRLRRDSALAQGPGAEGARLLAGSCTAGPACVRGIDAARRPSARIRARCACRLCRARAAPPPALLGAGARGAAGPPCVPRKCVPPHGAALTAARPPSAEQRAGWARARAAPRRASGGVSLRARRQAAVGQHAGARRAGGGAAAGRRRGAAGRRRARGAGHSRGRHGRRHVRGRRQGGPGSRRRQAGGGRPGRQAGPRAARPALAPAAHHRCARARRPSTAAHAACQAAGTRSMPS